MKIQNLQKFISTIFKNNKHFLSSFLIFVVSTIIVFYSFPKKNILIPNYEKNKPWEHEDLISPFDFSLIKSKNEKKIEKENILKNSYSYFNIDDKILLQVKNKFTKDFDASWEKFFKHEFKNQKNIFLNYYNVNENDLKEILIKEGLSIIDSIYFKGIIELPNKNQAGEIVIIKDKKEIEYDKNQFLNIQQAKDLTNVILIDNITNYQLINFIGNIIIENIKPNILFNSKLTEESINEKLKTLGYNKGKISKKEIIVSRGEIVTDNIMIKLQSLKKGYLKPSTKKNKQLNSFGKLIIILSVFSLLYLFLLRFYKDILLNKKKLLSILSLFILNIVISKFSISFDSIKIYAIPIIILPIILKIFYNITITIVVYTLNIIIISVFISAPSEFIFIQISAGLFAILLLKNLNNRSQILVISILTFFIYSINFIGFSMLKNETFFNIKWEKIYYFFINSILLLLTYPLVSVFEKIFGMLSDLRLLELCNTNSPLLKRLSSKAPGTFQHSLQVANLSEEIGQELQLNPLLLKAGGLYHDIGKMNNPLYFIENQKNIKNPHDFCSPLESAKIIIRHVSDGIDIALRNSIPKEIIDFIKTHHAKNTVQYFYKKELESNPKAVKSDFQYPGPKPFSKETAILMIVDSIEATTRSLDKKTDKELFFVIDTIIDQICNYKHIQESNITFKDITKIKTILKRKLSSIYHERIKY